MTPSELWLRFCDSLGLDRDEVRAASPNASTSALIACMRSRANERTLHEGLAALYSYKSVAGACRREGKDRRSRAIHGMEGGVFQKKRLRNLARVAEPALR